jgi:colicin import membrane protein
MPRKLKTFVTESGFFELAVAAPSMKAALRDWGIDVNLFQQGLARETDDPAIVAAAEAVPGKVLRRPIGSKAPFGDTGALPKVKGAPAGRRPQPKMKASAGEKVKAKESRHPAVDLHAIRQARTALHQAEARHDLKIAALDRKRVALERSAERLERDWRREKEKLEEKIARLKSE